MVSIMHWNDHTPGGPRPGPLGGGPRPGRNGMGVECVRACVWAFVFKVTLSTLMAVAKKNMENLLGKVSRLHRAVKSKIVDSKKSQLWK